MYEEGGEVQGPELVWKNPEQKDLNILRKFIRPDVQPPYTETYWKNINSEPIDYEKIAERQRFMESAYNNRAVSHKEARGAWGIMPSAKREYIQLGKGRPGSLNDPKYNRKVRDYMMRRVTRSDAFYSEDTDSVRIGKQLAYYNWGMGNMRNYLKQQEKKGVDTRYSFDWLEELPEETKNYVNFILRNRDINEHKNQEEYERLRDRYYSKHRYSSGGHLYDGNTENDQYLHTLDKYVRRNPMGIWENTPEASSVRKYLYRNAPDRMSSYYFSLPEETRGDINPKFIPDSIKSEDIRRKVSDTINEFGAEYAAPVVLSLGTGALGQAAAPVITRAVPALRHTARVLMNPAKARTTTGALASTALNSYGISTGIHDGLNLMTKITEGKTVPFTKVAQVALENTPAKIVGPVGKFIDKGVGTLWMLPKHFYIKRKLIKSPDFISNIERVCQNTLNYNLGREIHHLETTEKRPHVYMRDIRKMYEDVLGKPKTTKSGTLIGTDIRQASLKEEMHNIWKESIPALGRSNSSEHYGEIVLYPGQFRLNYLEKQIPTTLAHEFQHRAQAVMGSYPYVRKKLNGFTPSNITSAENMPDWGIPDIHHPAYPVMSVLEGKGRDSWIQSPEEVDSEMALIREAFKHNVPFNEMTPKEKKKAINYISDTFALSKQDTENLLSGMAAFSYKTGGKINKIW